MKSKQDGPLKDHERAVCVGYESLSERMARS